MSKKQSQGSPIDETSVPLDAAVMPGRSSLSDLPILDVQGFTPLGRDIKVEGVDPGQIPQTPAELGELLSYTYDLTVKRAGELNIPVIGSVSGGFDRRVVVFEWTRYKSLFDDTGTEYRYGYVIRFCLTVSKWDIQGQVSLPYLTAQAELGNIQASWLMQVRGLTGPKIDAVVLPPQELEVETFVIAKQSLDKAIQAIADPSTNFVPGILLSKVDPSSTEVDYWFSAVKAFAMNSIRRGRSRAQAVARLGSTDSAANDTIVEVYNYFGLSDPNQEPSSAARENARRLLGGIAADV